MVRLWLLAATLAAAVSVPRGDALAAPSYRGDAGWVAEVEAAVQKFLTAPSWRARIRTSSGTTVTADFAAPDRFHFLLPGRPPREGYAVGKTTWIRAGGRCRKISLPPSYGNPRSIVEHPEASSVTVIKAATDAVDGAPARVFTLVVDREGKQTQERLFVDQATGLPRRVEVPTANGPTIVNYSDYGLAVTVADPPC